MSSGLQVLSGLSYLAFTTLLDLICLTVKMTCWYPHPATPQVPPGPPKQNLKKFKILPVKFWRPEKRSSLQVVKTLLTGLLVSFFGVSSALLLESPKRRPNEGRTLKLRSVLEKWKPAELLLMLLRKCWWVLLYYEALEGQNEGWRAAKAR